MSNSICLVFFRLLWGTHSKWWLMFHPMLQPKNANLTLVALDWLFGSNLALLSNLLRFGTVSMCSLGVACLGLSCFALCLPGSPIFRCVWTCLGNDLDLLLFCKSNSWLFWGLRLPLDLLTILSFLGAQPLLAASCSFWRGIILPCEQ